MNDPPLPRCIKCSTALSDPRIPICPRCIPGTGLFTRCRFCGQVIAYVEDISLPTDMCYDCERLIHRTFVGYSRPINTSCLKGDPLDIYLQSLAGRLTEPSLIDRKDLASSQAVPQLTVRNAPELQALREVLSSATYYFRGQVGEFYRGSQAWIAPSMFRRKDLYAKRDLLAFDHARAAVEWLLALRGFMPKKFLERTYHYPNGMIRIQRDMSVLAEQPAVLGVMQHYGYPTHLLDLTSDLNVAFWFATHKFSRAMTPGLFCYHAVTFESDPWPTIYVFRESEDIIKWPPSEIVSNKIPRPSAQSGVFLSMGSVEVSPFVENLVDITVDQHEALQRVCCVLKVAPNLLDDSIARNTDTLFPKKDPLDSFLRGKPPLGFIPYG